MQLKFFNIRSYGIMINHRNEILISDEIYHGQLFSKFPGGGMELGESLSDSLRREFMEECQLNLTSLNLLHITDTVVASIFDNSQVIGVYYQVFTDELLSIPTKTIAFDFEEDSQQSFRWVSLQNFKAEDLTFEMDQHAWNAIKGKIIT
ncbi:NUDIX domain-containing protein [Albibacterium bauzanense]|uniref:8-oxo-dGTP pyrophosphatase MutT (NUDIX family) n=1 Tax=Albibacterium bauzanense TaxID=653929 RepID=A0A4V2PY63_9SPHI|nr:NUDIX domain-containing protein [Albibacterium bauzanense]TCK84811.1 8-oxo-dGTP pyrophosphatase MutT (NUDIX family) [Albibacterium bauzanense]